MTSLTKLPEQLDALRLWDGSPIPPGLRRRVLRVYAQYTLLSEQIAAVDGERRAQLQASTDARVDQVRQLMLLKGIGINGAWLFVAACDMALWVADYFHEFRDLYEVLQQVERRAYAAIDTEYEAIRTFANVKSEANLHKRLAHYDTAHRACEQAMALYDHLALLLHWLREALHVCSLHGRLRTQAPRSTMI